MVFRGGNGGVPLHLASAYVVAYFRRTELLLGVVRALSHTR